MSRKLLKFIHSVIIMPGALLFAIFLMKGMKLVAYLCLAATLAVMIYTGYRLRCPGCGRWPGKRHLFDRYCPTCGEYLGD